MASPIKDWPSSSPLAEFPEDLNPNSSICKLHLSYMQGLNLDPVVNEYLQQIQRAVKTSYICLCLFKGLFSRKTALIGIRQTEKDKPLGEDPLANLCRQIPDLEEGAVDWLTGRLGLPGSAELRWFLPAGVKFWCVHLILHRSRPVGFLVMGFEQKTSEFEHYISRIERLSQELLVLVGRHEFASWNRAHGHAGHLIGFSKAILTTELLAKKCAAGNCPVLITGETGTGKELVARMLHFYSSRRDKPLVIVNCGAFTSEHLLASELFGHTKGAFTDARTAKQGKFELAEGGTLFLDEVSTMSMTMQIALLRTLRYGEIQKVGDERPMTKVNVRVVAACNEDLGELVARGSFRADVYSRLRVAHIHVPPLRQRLEDVPILVEYFLNHLASQVDRPVKKVSPDVMELLSKEKWPDNIAGLENCLLHADLMADGDIQREHLPAAMQEPVQESADSLEHGTNGTHGSFPDSAFVQSRQLSLRDAVASFEKRYIQSVLADSAYNISLAARILGISRQGLQKKLQRLRCPVLGRAPASVGNSGNSHTS
jgi:two-component system, NtrC family, nitrogen regulation response regulator NtrX